MEKNKLFDVVALVDMIQRSGLLTEIECSDFKKSVYDIHFFTNRRKIDGEKFNLMIITKDYHHKIEELLKEKQIHYKF